MRPVSRIAMTTADTRPWQRSDRVAGSGGGDDQRDGLGPRHG